MSNITYIFTSGRSDKVNNKNYADDFFYGCRYLSKDFDINIIEFSKVNKFFKKIEHILSKVLSLPFYVFSLLSFDKIKIILNSNKIVLVSESTAFAILPILLFSKKKRNIQVYLFVMGLYSKNLNYKFASMLHKFFIKFLYKYIDKLFFLGYPEYLNAINLHQENNKIFYRPFCVDVSFWTQYSNTENFMNRDILFIGNDGNRNYELLLEIATLMNDYNFSFVSSNTKLTNSNLKNIKVFNGNWSVGKYDDLYIKNIYQKSSLVILPINNSYQPSGQSVALQAMSMGKSVMISKTKGFWSEFDFQHKENIIFVDSNDANEWKKEIEYYFENMNISNQISKKSRNLVREKYNLEKFNKQLVLDLNLSNTI